MAVTGAIDVDLRAYVQSAALFDSPDRGDGAIVGCDQGHGRSQPHVDTRRECDLQQRAAKAVGVEGNREVGLHGRVHRFSPGFHPKDDLAEEAAHKWHVTSVGDLVEVDETPGGVAAQRERFFEQDGAGSRTGG